MEKISVKVCMGTTCFVMGGANLQELTEIIPRKYGDKVLGLMVEHDVAKVAAEGAAAKVRTNLAEYLEKGVVK